MASPSVRVRREIYFARVLRFLFQFLNERAFSLNVDVFCLESILDIHAERALGQISDVTLGCDDAESVAEIRADSGCFCR